MDRHPSMSASQCMTELVVWGECSRQVFFRRVSTYCSYTQRVYAFFFYGCLPMFLEEAPRIFFFTIFYYFALDGYSPNLPHTPSLLFGISTSWWKGCNIARNALSLEFLHCFCLVLPQCLHQLINEFLQKINTNRVFVFKYQIDELKRSLTSSTPSTHVFFVRKKCSFYGIFSLIWVWNGPRTEFMHLF